MSIYLSQFSRGESGRGQCYKHSSLVINGLASVSEKDAKMTKKGKNSGGTGKVAFFLLFIKPTYDDAAELLESKQSAGKSSWHYFSDCYLFTHNRPFIHYNVVQSGFLIISINKPHRNLTIPRHALGTAVVSSAKAVRADATSDSAMSAVVLEVILISVPTYSCQVNFSFMQCALNYGINVVVTMFEPSGSYAFSY